MMTPDDIDVWVGLDVGKSAHHAPPSTMTGTPCTTSR